MAPRSDDEMNVNIAAGMFRVYVGARRFTCLRSIDLELKSSGKGKESLEHTILAETFHARSGEIVLFRRYNGRLWKTQKKDSPYAGVPWDERYPENARLTINGAVFVHWYDCLTDSSK